MPNAVAASVCPHDCPSVCALLIETTPEGRLAKVRGSDRVPFTAGVICAKVARYAERHHHPDRLLRPLLRTGPKGSGQFREIGWDEALDRTAEGLLEAERRLGPQGVWPYWYAGTMGLVNRDGINRLTHAKGWSRFKSTICVMLSDTGFKAGAGTRRGVPATEMAEHADLVVVWGCNPVTTHVNLMSHIARARKERAAPLVVIDPYRSPTAEQADLHLAPLPGTDAALACGIMHVLFRDGHADRAYLDRFTDDPAGLERHLRSRTPEWAAAVTGLPVSAIETFAAMYGRAKASWLRLGYGFTRQRNGAVAMHAASCLPAVTGAWAHQGGGAFYNMGDLYKFDKTLIEGLDRLDPATRALDQSRIGPILVGDADALLGGPPVGALLVQSTNPMCVAPELGKVRAGFSREDLFVTVHEQFMTDTARMADIVLPATMFLEHDDVYQAAAHATIQIGPRILPPQGACRSNHEVVCALADRVGAQHPGFAMSAMELVDDLLRRSGWPDAAAVLAAGGHEVLPDPRAAHFADGFGHPDGRFHFRADWAAFGPHHKGMPTFPDHLAIIDERSPEHPYRLVAAPARQFLNTSFTEMPTGRKREGQPTALIHPARMTQLGLADGDLVRLGNARGEVTLRARGRDGQHEDTIVVEGIWPNGDWAGGIGINLLLGADPAPPNGGAAVHDTAVWLEPATQPAQEECEAALAAE